MSALRQTGPLGNMPLFNGLMPDQVSRLSAELRHRTYASSVNIISMDQPGEVVYIVIEGTVKIYVGQPDGANVILAILGPGEVVGEMGPVEGSERSADVVTLEQTTVAWVGQSTFKEWLKTEPLLAYNLSRILSRRLRLANAHIRSLSALDVNGRVARQLLAFAQEYGNPANGDVRIPLHLTQSDLADMIGASRVSVNKVLVYYKEQKYISVDSTSRITIHDHSALAQRSQ